MILTSLTIENFRQFKGKKVLDLRPDGNCNVVVFHGENGTGKTTILNAITWCLYDETSQDFQNATELANRWVLANESDFQVRVTLEFNHDGVNYTAERAIPYLSHSGKPVAQTPVFHLLKQTLDGQTKPVKNQDATISRILPREMSSYFFFNGERITVLGRPNHSALLKRAVEGIMGLEVLKRLGEHLSLHEKSVARRAKSDVRVSDELRQAYEVEAKAKELLQEAKNKATTLKSDLESLTTQKEDYDAKLRGTGEAKELQAHRDSLTNRIDVLTKEREQNDAQLRQLIIEKGFSVFFERVLDGAHFLISKLEEEGQLPPPIQPEVLTGLLNGGECICGRDLTPDTSEYQRIEAKIALTEGMDFGQQVSAYQRAEAISKSYAKAFPREISRVFNRKAELSQEASDISADLDNIHEKIKRISGGVTDVSALEKMRSEVETSCNSKLKDLTILEDRIDSFKKEIVSAQSTIEALKKKSNKNSLVESELELTKQMNGLAEQKYSNFLKQTREKLSKRISDIYENVKQKSYRVTMNEDFTIEVIDDRGQVVNQSTGECQITSLCFIGSLVDYAREVFSTDLTGTKHSFGGIYPVVMDSPFGTLDKHHRQEVSRAIPQLSDQIILFVSSTQWRGEVETQMEPRISKRYKIVTHGETKEKTEWSELEEVA